MKTGLKKYTPPAVSRYYRFDWQYAVDIYKQTSLRVVSLITFLVPILLEAKTVVAFTIPTNFWFFWGAGVAYILSLLTFYIGCPRFIREYRDYGQYLKRGHSHRWIVWEFYNNLELLEGWERIVRETVTKGIAVDDSSPKFREILKRISGFEAAAEDKVIINRPVNLDRDIYIPINIDGGRIIIFLEENDKKLQEKERELFWILYSQAAKEQKLARIIYWFFAYASFILFFLLILSTFGKLICH